MRICQNPQGHFLYTHEFLLQNNITDLSFPASNGLCEFVIELLRAWPIGRTLEDLQFNEQFSNDIFSFSQNFRPVHLNVKVLQSATCVAHLLQSSDTRVDQILGDAESERKAVEQS